MKKQKQITVTNFILGILCMITIFFAIHIDSGKDELKNEIAQLNKELEEEKESSTIYDKTIEFIKLSSEAKHESLLTGKAKEEYELALEQEGKEDHHHSHNTLDKYEIDNIYVVKTDKDKANSYAIFRLYYKNNSNSDSITTQRILTLSLITSWEKTEDGYKVNDYKINLLQDSLDEYLKEVASYEE